MLKVMTPNFFLLMAGLHVLTTLEHYYSKCIKNLQRQHQIMDSKHHSPIKNQDKNWRSGWFKDRARRSQDEPRTPCDFKKEGSTNKKMKI